MFQNIFLLRYEVGFFGSNLKIERIKNQKNNWVLKIVTVASKCDFKHYVNTETPKCISLNVFCLDPLYFSTSS